MIYKPAEFMFLAWTMICSSRCAILLGLVFVSTEPPGHSVKSFHGVVTGSSSTLSNAMTVMTTIPMVVLTNVVLLLRVHAQIVVWVDDTAMMTEGEVPVDRTFDKFGFEAIARTETLVGHRQDGSGSVTVYRNADNGDELSPVQVITPPDHGLSNELTTGFGAALVRRSAISLLAPRRGVETEAVGGTTIHGAGAVYVYEYQSQQLYGCFRHVFSDAPQRDAYFGKAAFFMMTIKGHTLLLVRLVIAFLVALSIRWH